MIFDGIERRTFAVLAANRDIAALWDLAEGVLEGWSTPRSVRQTVNPLISFKRLIFR